MNRDPNVYNEGYPPQGVQPPYPPQAVGGYPAYPPQAGRRASLSLLPILIVNRI